MSNFKKKLEIGEKVLQCGKEYAELLSIDSDSNICCIRFDSGLIRENVPYSSFKSGRVVSEKSKGINSKGKHDLIGLRVVQKEGYVAEIIELLPNNRCKARFDTGKIKEVSLDYFRRGRVSINDAVRLKVGDSKVQSNGHLCTVLEIKQGRLIDVIYDNGVVRRDVSASHFQSGKLGLNNRIKVGTRILQKCGAYAEVVKLDPNDKCTVRFDSGVVRENVYRQNFKEGSVAEYPKAEKYVGLRVVAVNGIGLEILEYNSYNDIVVKSDDGKISKTSITTFNKGSSMLTNSPNIVKERDMLGVVKSQKDGYKAKCVSCEGKKVTIEYPWGYRKVIGKQMFMSGTSSLAKWETYIGRTCSNKFNMKYYIVSYNNGLFTVKFEDGSIVECEPVKVYNDNVYHETMLALSGGCVVLQSNKTYSVKKVYFDTKINRYIVLTEKNRVRELLKL